jgi:cell division protein ZapA
MSNRDQSDMSQVSVSINGRKFRMACENGQEARLTQLASDFDNRIGQLRASFGEIGDTRLTVMAALTVADELVEVTGKLRRLEAEFAALQDARVTAAERAKTTQATVSAALTSAADRIESLARRLNQIPSNGSDTAGVAMG